MTKLYTHIAREFDRVKLLQTPGHPRGELAAEVKAALDKLVKDRLPSGSGFDSGTQLDWDLSKPNRLVFTTKYHHMNSDGFYTRWTEHDVIVTPDLAFGMDVRVTGRDHNDIKDYIHHCFHPALMEEV